MKTHGRKPSVRSWRQFSVMVCTFLFLLESGCGTMQNGRRWGEDAFSSPSLEKIGRSAFHALVDWQTLVPAAGALIFSIDHFDTRVSDWASQHHPIFGSESGAKTASDLLYAGTYLEALGTSLATPSGEDSKEWMSAKAKGLGVELLGLGLTGGTTVLLRDTTHRSAPDGAQDQSPSGHASIGFGNLTFANRNLNYIPMSDNVRIPIQAGNLVYAAFLCWARVEARGHYPTDVLVGAAIGHFFNAFVYDAFMNVPESKNFGISVIPQKGGGILTLSFSY